MFKGKVFIFSAPSGSGKTTIVRHLLNTFPNLGFSISATTRKKRSGEIDKKDYYFLTRNDFELKIKQNEFVEWEQVYEDLYYGTLNSEVLRLWNQGKHVVFDVDVVGGLNLKKYFGNDGLSVFVKVPSIDELEKRLRLRNTETEKSINKRLERVKYELGFEKDFDIVLVNDNLEKSCKTAEKLVENFLKKIE